MAKVFVNIIWTRVLKMRVNGAYNLVKHIWVSNKKTYVTILIIQNTRVHVKQNKHFIKWCKHTILLDFELFEIEIIFFDFLAFVI